MARLTKPLVEREPAAEELFGATNMRDRRHACREIDGLTGSLSSCKFVKFNLT